MTYLRHHHIVHVKYVLFDTKHVIVCRPKICQTMAWAIFLALALFGLVVVQFLNALAKMFKDTENSSNRLKTLNWGQ